MKKFNIALCLLLYFSSAASSRNLLDVDQNGIEAILKDYSKYESVKDQRGVKCQAQLLSFLRGLSSGSGWALQMADSYGKIASGLSLGNLNSLGSFDECLQVSHDSVLTGSIQGKYCNGIIPISVLGRMAGNEQYFNHLQRIKNITNKFGPQENMPRLINVFDNILFYRLGVCVPDSCTGPEIEGFVTKIVQDTLGLDGAQVLINEDSCYTTGKLPWTTGDWVTIGLLSLAVLLAGLSTLYELWFVFYSKKDESTKNQLLASFSLYTNSKKLTSISRNPGPLASLNGMRFFSMAWVVLGHGYLTELFSPLENYVELLDWAEQKWTSSFIGNASYSVDTFFVMSGVLMSYVFFTKYEKDKKFNIIMFYVHRFLRLTPALVIAVLINTYLLRHFGSGPIWEMVTEIMKFCENNWWATILYVNNYVNNAEMCVGQTWYLSADMQLYVLSPLLILPLIYKPKLGLIWASFVTLFFLFLVTVLAAVNNWDAAMGIEDDGRTQLAYYYATHTRATPYFMGFIVGYLLVKSRKDLKINKILVLIGWITAFAIMLGVIVGGHNITREAHINTKAENVLYLTFARPAWALGLLWIIVANFYGYGGPINWFLSLDIFQILARLTYSMYLIHLQLQFVLVGSRKTTNHFSHQEFAINQAGNFVFFLVICFFYCMLFESPIINLERVLLGGGQRKVVTKEKPEIVDIENPKLENSQFAKEKL